MLTERRLRLDGQCGKHGPTQQGQQLPNKFIFIAKLSQNLKHKTIIFSGKTEILCGL